MRLATIVLVVGLTGISFLDAGAQAPAKTFASPKIELLQTRVQAEITCGSNDSIIAATDAAVMIGGAAIDAYLASSGYTGENMQGLGSGLLGSIANQGNRNWLYARLGIKGNATCATQCVLVPKEQEAGLSVFGCLSETGGDGLDCGANGWNGEWRGVDSYSAAAQGNGVLFCMRGKNSSDNRNRWFWVVATNRNPLSGQPLDRVYRQQN